VGAAALALLLAASTAEAQTAQGDASSVDGAIQVTVLEQELKQASEEIKTLEKRAPALADEADKLIQQLNELPPKVVKPPDPPDPNKPLQVEFRPPFLRESKKPKGLVLMLESGRITVVQMKPLNDVINARWPQVESDALSGKTSWDETWPVAGSPFDIQFKASATRIAGGVTLQYLRQLKRKPGDEHAGEPTSALQDASSKASEALRGAGPATHALQIAVYPDSFDAYRVIRSFAWKLGYEIGWVPVATGEMVGVGSGGIGVQ
jgi:hypothetical protein